MITVFDVPADALIEEISKDLREKFKVLQPNYVNFVKTGASREKAPLRRDWFYVRMASILRRIYVDGSTGTGSLRTYYGGKKNRGVKPEKFYKASGKIIRNCLQELEKIGLIEKTKKGRRVSAKGTSYLNKKAKELFDSLKKKK